MSERPARRRAAGRGERGTAAVEFALVLPLVLLMTVAVLQVGLFVKDRLILQDAARAGAREAAVTTQDDQVRQATEEAAASLDPSLMEVTITREGGSGTAVTVDVHYHDRPDLDLVTWLFPATVELEATATMRQETG